MCEGQYGREELYFVDLEGMHFESRHKVRMSVHCKHSQLLMDNYFTRKSKIMLLRHGWEVFFTLGRGLSVERNPRYLVDRWSHRVHGFSFLFHSQYDR